MNIKATIKNLNMEKLCRKLKSSGFIQSDDVYNAMLNVDRGDFTEDVNFAYVDR